MNMKIISGLLGIVTFVAGSLVNAATLSVSPSVSNVIVGDAFTLTVEGTAFDAGVSSGGINLVWDPTKVTMTTTAGEIAAGLDAAGLGDIFTFAFDAAAGTLDTTFFAPFDFINGTFGSIPGPDFTLLTLDFLAIPPPSTSTIDIAISANAGDWQDGTQPVAQPIVVDFVGATINVSPVPVPAAVWLFGSGLLGLVGIARRRVTQPA